jgi:uncharacterized membrane protein YedE/YeeE
MVEAILGGILIAAAGLGLFYFNLQICGISGMIEGVLPPKESDWPWRLAFLTGLVTGGVILLLFYPKAFDWSFDISLPTILFSGFLVGFGTRLGLGCTSGHGVCGVARFSPRFLIATCIFLAAGIATATIFRTVT